MATFKFCVIPADLRSVFTEKLAQKIWLGIFGENTRVKF